MDDRYRLLALGNEQLLAALKGLVRREQYAMADMLAHLAELDERRLFLDLGYPSLFAYCTEALGLCKSSAGRRIAAARVCRKYPQAFLRVAKGELQLSVLSVLASHLNADNAAELFAACVNKSFEQVEELLATRFPRPDVRDLIRRLPDASRRTPNIGSGYPEPARGQGADAESSADHPAVAEQGLIPATASAELNASSLTAIPMQRPAETPPPAITRERIEPLSPDRFGVHFTADGEFRDLLEEVRALVSHQQPKGELMPLMKRALEAFRRELQKKRFAVGAKSPRAAAATAQPNAKRTRRATAAVRRAVYERDDGSCTFVSEEGRRCGTRQFLELDHVQPWALDGESTVENLRLRCRAHNQQSARSDFGSARMLAAVQCARRQRQNGII